MSPGISETCEEIAEASGSGYQLAPLLAAVQEQKPYWVYQFPAMILCVTGADFIFACGIMYSSKVAGPGQQGQT